MRENNETIDWWIIRQVLEGYSLLFYISWGLVEPPPPSGVYKANKGLSYHFIKNIQPIKCGLQQPFAICFFTDFHQLCIAIIISRRFYLWRLTGMIGKALIDVRSSYLL